MADETIGACGSAVRWLGEAIVGATGSTRQRSETRYGSRWQFHDRFVAVPWHRHEKKTGNVEIPRRFAIQNIGSVERCRCRWKHEKRTMGVRERPVLALWTYHQNIMGFAERTRGATMKAR